MHWHEFGGGVKTVLILHGAPSNLQTVRPLVDELSVDHRVLVPEMPGYGGSPALPSPYSLAAAHDLIERELAARAVGEVAIIGFSLGVYRGLKLALARHASVSDLVLLGGFANLRPPEREGLKGFAGLLKTMTDFNDPSARRIFAERMLSPGFLREHPEAGQQVEHWLDATTPSVLAGELEATAGLDDLTEAMSSLTCPITAIVGEHDLPSPPEHSEAIVRAVRRGKLHIIKGSGHAVLIESEAEVLRLVGAALRHGGWPAVSG